MLGDSQFQRIVAPNDTSLAQPPPTAPVDPTSSTHAKSSTPPTRRTSRKPGRPATYVFDKPDEQLSEKERKMKISIEKRRLRQNRSYHRRKKVRKNQPPEPNHPSTAIHISDASALQHVLSANAGAHPAWSILSPGTSPATVAAAAAAVAAAAATAAAAVASPMMSVNAAAPSDNPNVSMTAATMSQPSMAHLTTPKPIADFSQNPLDLLASATATGANSSSASFGPACPVPMKCSTPSIVKADEPSPPQDAIALSPDVEVDTVEIDATEDRMEEMSSFSLGLEVQKIQPEGEEADPTDVLVKSAMVAAKEYAKDPLNLKDVMDRETELRRMTGIKTIVFDNLRAKYMGLSPNMQKALRHFIIFPRTFSLNAAASVAGIDENQLVNMQGMLDSMIQTNFITTTKGRYELNEAARLFLNEDTSVLTDNIANSTYQMAQKRFVNHYRKHLGKLQDDDIHKIGWLREQAMALYDCERENMEFSEYLLNGRNTELREFLSAGITVMRYCVSASNRERVLRKALGDDETSTEDIVMTTFGTGDVSVGSSVGGTNATNVGMVLDGSVSSLSESGHNNTITTTITAKEDDKTTRARLYLALSEAFFDQLKMEEAEQPLLEALKLMGDTSPKSGASSASIVDSVLVLLLLSNLRMTSGRVRDARVLCVKALRILAEAGLGRSTFGINAMSNLVTIYLMEGHLDKAKSVASRLLDTLNTMRYTGMPIYADALGVCAMVSMAETDYKEAEKQYGRALETVGKWGSKEWTGIPVQHCLDLDLWLMEGLAECIRRQGKIDSALVLEARAAEDRSSRGLPRNAAMPQLLQSGQQYADKFGSSQENKPPSLRHLY